MECLHQEDYFISNYNFYFEFVQLTAIFQYLLRQNETSSKIPKRGYLFNGGTASVWRYLEVSWR